MHAFDRVDVLGKHYPPGFERGISARCVLVANRPVTDIVKAQVFLRTFAGYRLDDHRKRMIGLNAEQYVRIECDVLCLFKLVYRPFGKAR